MTVKELAKQVEENAKRLDNHLEEIKKNGIIYDTFDCRDREVEYVWLIR